MSQAERFDVFLSHNSSDKPTVIEIGELLKARGLKVWLDVWELRPGLPWQEQVENVIKATRAAAILIGRDGRGPWQELEMRAVLAQFVRRRAPAIPVLLPGAAAEPDLPLFLQEFTWVDFRNGLDRQGLDRLAWGITGAKPLSRPKEEEFVGRRAPAVHNLPSSSLGTLFKGRAELLTTVAADLELNPAAAIVQHQRVIHGLGGIGKTRLAVEYAWRSAERYRWAFFVPASSREALNRGLVRLADPDLMNLKVEDVAEKETVKHVLRWLRDHGQWLLILDNVDSEEAALAVRELLPLLGEHVLVTSRLAAWPGIPRRNVEKLEPVDGARYLLERTDGERRSSDGDDELARRLAELLDGLPLALEQAGAQIAAEGLSFRQYLEAWEGDHSTVLEWFDRLQIPGYPASLAVTWQRSFTQLAPVSRALLRLLAHLAADPVPVEMLESGAEVLEEGVKLLDDETESSTRTASPAEALAGLVKYSLITRLENDVRIHRMVQEVVRGRIPEARRRDWVEKAVRMVDEFSPAHPDDGRTWPIWDRLRPHAGRVIELAERAGIETAASRLMGNLGILLNTKCVYSEAEPLIRRQLEIYKGTYGSEHEAVAISLNNLAMLLKETNRPAEAEALIRRAIEIDEGVFGTDSPAVANNLNNLATVLEATNRLAEAESLMRRALDINMSTYGFGHPNVATALSNLAHLVYKANRPAEAELLMRRALKSSEDSEDPGFATRLNNLAALLQATHRPAEAEPLLRRALEIKETSFGPEHPEVALVLQNLAQLRQATNRPAEAEPLLRRALEILTQSFGVEHPSSRAVQANLDRLLQAMADE
ncbi:MAG: tetratricopeptide repeat protein [bacterium]|nr:tetratricopeptide repeat protein [bacterium]